MPILYASVLTLTNKKATKLRTLLEIANLVTTEVNRMMPRVAWYSCKDTSVLPSQTIQRLTNRRLLKKVEDFPLWTLWLTCNSQAIVCVLIKTSCPAKLRRLFAQQPSYRISQVSSFQQSRQIWTRLISSPHLVTFRLTSSLWLSVDL